MIRSTRKIKLFLVGVFVSIIFYIIVKPYYDFVSKTLQISLVKTLLSLDSLQTHNNNVAILLLGIAGKNHDGPNLSDTIIVANYNLKSNKLLTISLPRDIWSDTLKDKINTAYAYGESKRKGGGLTLAKAEMSAVVGI